jgi:hypothetical protein
MRHGGVAALALDGDEHHVGRGQQRARTGGDQARGDRRRLVDGERPRHGLAAGRPAGARVEQALLQRPGRATLALLARLEEEPDPAGQVAPVLGQQPGGADEHGGVGVVPAGVHDPVDLGGVVEAGVVGHGQGVHVGPQQDRRPRPAAVEVGHDRAQPLAGGDRERQPGQGVEHPGLGGRQVEAQLGAAVEVAAQRHHVVVQGAGLGQQVVGRRARRVAHRAIIPNW